MEACSETHPLVKVMGLNYLYKCKVHIASVCIQCKAMKIVNLQAEKR
jgi:hypothetical protein